jgi:hypothetical protein
MRIRSLAPLAIVALLAGCASQAGVESEPLHAGVARSFNANFDKVLTATREAMVDANLQIESANAIDQNTYMIMAKAGTSAFSWGEIVRCVVVRESDTSTTVRVLTKRKGTLNIAAKGDYSQSIHSNIELKLRASN